MAQAAYPETPPFGTRTGSSVSFPYLALHREEFTWPPNVTTDAGELLPHRFTHHPRSLDRGLVCSLLHLSSPIIKVPGRYPARCPMVFGLSSVYHSDHPTRLNYQGSESIAKFVEQSKNLLHGC